MTFPIGKSQFHPKKLYRLMAKTKFDSRSKWTKFNRSIFQFQARFQTNNVWNKTRKKMWYHLSLADLRKNCEFHVLSVNALARLMDMFLCHKEKSIFYILRENSFIIVLLWWATFDRAVYRTSTTIVKCCHEKQVTRNV